MRWGLPIGVLAIGITTALFGFIGASLRTLVVGQDNRISTSKTVAAIWTFIVGAMLLGLVYAKLLNHPQALDATNSAGVIGQYALLFGGPLGAAILAKGIVNHQLENSQATRPRASSPSTADLVANDAGEVDLGDYQYVIFNLIALVYVLGTLLHDPTRGLPHIPDVLLGLTSVSAVGYVGKKALMPSGTVIGRLTPATGAAKTAVTVTLTGIVPAEQANVPMWVRFGEANGEVKAAQVVGGNASLQVEAPDLGLKAGSVVDVTVGFATGDVAKVGEYTY